MAVWTDELKAELVEDYVSKDPTPENTIEIVNALADKYDGTVNSIRVMLGKANVYVKKGTTAVAGSDDKEAAPKRVSKADAVASLNAAITDLGLEPDETIVDKLTGKAALYFAGVIRSTQTSD